MVATLCPVPVTRTSGSAPRFPISNTLFRLAIIFSPFILSFCSTPYSFLYILMGGTTGSQIRRFPPSPSLSDWQSQILARYFIFLLNSLFIFIHFNGGNDRL